MPKKTKKAKSEAALRRKKMDPPARKNSPQSELTTTGSGFRYALSLSEKTKPAQTQTSHHADDSLYAATKKDIMTTVIYACIAIVTLIVISLVLP